MSAPVSHLFAEFACAAAAAALPGEVAERARLCVVDHLHAALHGARSDTASILRRYRGEPRGDEATALALGALSTVYEIDDVHRDTSMHAGSVVVSAALAAAGQDGAGQGGVGDARLLAAVAAGYEMAIRLSVAAGERHYHYHQSTATCGTVAAAVAAGVVLGLDAPRMANAIGLAATMASGLWEDISNAAITVKHLHSGFAAERGVRAAKLAALGVGGARRALEGPKGFLAALARPDAAYPREAAPDEAALRAVMTDGLGQRWAILRNIYKRYPFCLGCFEPLEGMRHILATTGRPAADIASVRVAIYTPTARLVGNRAPRDQLQAKFSVAFAIALLLAGRDPENVLLPVEWLSDPDVVRWYPKIACIADDTMRPRKALVHVDWADGTSTLGDEPLRSLEAGEVSARFEALCRGRPGPEAAALPSRLAALGARPDCADLVAMARKAIDL